MSIETTQVIRAEITFIDNVKTADEIKKLLNADQVKIIQDKRFEMDKKPTEE